MREIHDHQVRPGADYESPVARSLSTSATFSEHLLRQEVQINVAATLIVVGGMLALLRWIMSAIAGRFLKATGGMP